MNSESRNKQEQNRASHFVGGSDDVRIIGETDIIPDSKIRAAFVKHGMPEKLAQYWIDQLYGWGYEPAEMIELAPAIVERSRQFASMGAEKFAQERWITIGAEGDEDGKGRKGRKVKIDEDGNIVGGSVPQDWRGKDVSNPATYGDKRYTVGEDDEVLPVEEKPENSKRSNEPTRKQEEPVDTADAYQAILGREPTPEEQDRISAAAEKMAEHADDPKAYWGSKDQPYWKPGPNPTVDAVITRDGPNGKQVLLIQRGEGTAEGGKWALPGGFHDSAGGARGEWWKPGKESAEDAALRELAEETGLDASAIKDRMQHVGSFDKHGRDPRDNEYAWAVSNAYSMHLDGDIANAAVAGLDDAQDAQWIDVSDLDGMETAFDHGDILREAGVVGGDRQDAERFAKAAEIGERREWKSGTHEKTADGWVPVSESPSEADPPADGEAEPATKKSRVRRAVEAVWNAVNAAPAVANAIVRETGAGPRTAKAAYAISLVGDYALPGVPAGSLAVALAATLVSPGAPRRAINTALAKWRERKEAKA